jgi:hypothetical protein
MNPTVCSIVGPVVAAAGGGGTAGPCWARMDIANVDVSIAAMTIDFFSIEFLLEK